LALIVSTMGAGVASAATTFPNSNYGFDGNANLVVGGGSTTLYKVAQGLADLYNSSASCTTNNSVASPATPTQVGSTSNTAVVYPQTNPAYNQCSPTSGQTYTGGSAGGNFDGDTIAIAAPAGSGTGIGSLNGDVSGTAATFAYEGTNASIPTQGDPNASNGLSNGFGTPDFALSSRGPKPSGGNCTGTNPTTGLAGDELQCDTFWGVAADGVEVFTWGSTVSGTTDSTNLSGLSDGLTASDLANIYDCTYTTWGQLPEYQEAVNLGDTVPPSAAPIVPWAMNSSSGTYADFNSYVSGNDGSLGFTNVDVHAGQYTGGSGSNPAPASATKCVRELAGSNPLPLENDVKPLLTDVNTNQGGLSTDTMSTNNPANWIWFGSYGLLKAYQYLSQPSLNGNTYSTTAAPVGPSGTSPSTANIGGGTYPIERTLSLVTTKADADCVLNTSGKCSGLNGPTNSNGVADMNMKGATSGVGGAVREFIRFVCRTSTEGAPTDPYTGKSYTTEIASAISNSGFTLPPSSTRSPGSDCNIQSVG
jgi:ABC-type phosphate transport system substrate-binding protein